MNLRSRHIRECSTHAPRLQLVVQSIYAVAAKIEALEQIDQHIIAPLVEALEQQGEYRILVTPDHPTPCSTKKHSHGMVPLVISGAGVQADSQTSYDELAAEASGRRFEKGWDLMDEFIKA